MDHEEYAIMYRAEDSHWWYRGMKAVTVGVLDRHVGRGHDLDILDAGCGTGMGLGYLRDFGRPVGIDFAPQALEFSTLRGARELVRGSVVELPFQSDSFDLITSFDVLSECGLGKDEMGMREFWRVLRPGGRLLVRLPAYEWLRSAHDARVHTRHRYSRGEVHRKLLDAGFHVDHSSYVNTFLFPLVMMKRLGERLLPLRAKGSDFTVQTGLLDRIFGRALAWEAPWVRSIGLPFGLTVLALATKPTEVTSHVHSGPWRDPASAGGHRWPQRQSVFKLRRGRG